MPDHKPHTAFSVWLLFKNNLLGQNAHNIIILFFIYFWWSHMACVILVPWPGMDSRPLQEVRNLNH